MKFPYTELRISFNAPAFTGSVFLMATRCFLISSYNSVASPRAFNLTMLEGYILATSLCFTLCHLPGFAGAPCRPPIPNTNLHPQVVMVLLLPLPSIFSFFKHSSHILHTSDGIPGVLFQYLSGILCLCHSALELSPISILADSVVVFHLYAFLEVSSESICKSPCFVSK